MCNSRAPRPSGVDAWSRSRLGHMLRSHRPRQAGPLLAEERALCLPTKLRSASSRALGSPRRFATAWQRMPLFRGPQHQGSETLETVLQNRLHERVLSMVFRRQLRPNRRSEEGHAAPPCSEAVWTAAEPVVPPSRVSQPRVDPAGLRACGTRRKLRQPGSRQLYPLADESV